MPDLPFVSVVIPTLNEAQHIHEALLSALHQDYPADLLEFLIVDGGSTDETLSIVAALGRDDARVRLLPNPAVIQSAGLNLGIRSTRGEIVARLDGHSAWEAHHLTRAVEILMATGADNVGGTMVPAGNSPLARAIARATGSWFGAGGATYRYGHRQAPAETVYLGVFRRSALERAGGFDESLAVHEDYELNMRIRATGGTIVFSPDLPTRYWPRETLRGLALQYFKYGQAKSAVGLRNPSALRLYHLAPPGLIAALSATALLGVWRGRYRPVAGLAIVYGVTCAVASMAAGAGSPFSVRARIPQVFVTAHLSWGAGFWFGLLAGLGPRSATRQRR